MNDGGSAIGADALTIARICADVVFALCFMISSCRGVTTHYLVFAGRAKKEGPRRFSVSIALDFFPTPSVNLNRPPVHANRNALFPTKIDSRFLSVAVAAKSLKI